MKNNSNPWDGWIISHSENKQLFDTVGMLCTCGKRLVHKGIENGCQVLACPNQKCIRQYQIPIDNRQTLEYPGERILRGWKPPIVPPNAVLIKTELALELPEKKYICLGRDCCCEITKEQAERTYKEHEKALCGVCEDRIKKK